MAIKIVDNIFKSMKQDLRKVMPARYGDEDCTNSTNGAAGSQTPSGRLCVSPMK